MTSFDPFASIVELGQQLRSGQLTSKSLTQGYLDRIKQYDKKFHAFVEILETRALEQAKFADSEFDAGVDRGPLHGIPYAAKDLFDIAGVPTRAGTELLSDNVPNENAFIVSRLEELGAILVGKTHTVQFAYGGVGINNKLGTPVNPWAREHHIPGGSSSGSGVAVGAGLVPMALGSDTGGSVRIPAAFNSVTGLKTTVGQISRRGVFPLSWTLDSVGPLTRNAKDAEVVYRLMAKQDFDDPSMQAFRPLIHMDEAASQESLVGYRLIYAQNVFFDECDPEVEKSVLDTASVFADLGASIEYRSVDVANAALRLNPKGLVIAAEAYYSNRLLVDKYFDQLDPIVSHRLIKGKEVTAVEYLDIQNGLTSIRHQAIEFFDTADALLVPTVMTPPCSVAACQASVDAYSKTNVSCLRNTAIGNMLNLSAVTVPCGFNVRGLPIGLMIYGRPFDEIKILKIARAFQDRTQWHSHRPRID
ncbi:MAG: amidase [Proteobacteria bacterium]|nr:amidase [Pseudomonadota bacterium]